MAVEENWQTKLPTVAQRTSFIFNNGVLSDVKFVVPVSTDGSESTKVIPAHKFVLAISSPVFFTMFYGQMAETKDSIELPDCEYESLFEFFRYIYSEKVNLSGSNVMQIYYLAKKYMMPLLAVKCSEYLEWILTPSDAFEIIHNAQEVDDKALEARCWKVIGIYTEEALTCDEFLSVERSDIECLVNRTALDIKEVELFKAVDRWAMKECERQGVSPDGEEKRRILGDEIVKAIRFPVMSRREFTSAVRNSHLLTDEEFGIVMKYYSHELKSPLPFSNIPRLKETHSKGNRSDVSSCKGKSLKGKGLITSRCSGSRLPLPPLPPFLRAAGIEPIGCNEEFLEETRFRCQRFNYSRHPVIFTDQCGLQFSVDKPIKLLGVQHYGAEVEEYSVYTCVRDTTSNALVARQSGIYLSEMDDNESYYCFDVLFDRPVYLETYKQYTVVSTVTGPIAWSGEQGQTFVESEGVLFTFSNAEDGISHGTSVVHGQLPAFIFCLDNATGSEDASADDTHSN